ncbi:head completion/stabilization protein [Bathymodiolus septemdierum thioautotrophic gill symbiont]|uniref:Uncharacterized protein n=1 Tax=endosymbiont of Bathymodiolus septemdierum str. Myojin knoll TaxID=1303921 RepID=A0A0P0UQY9_9GAMM|nr:head completion/stabilization protein [Bathymodiolus septemdierum thioautotrophic gill symbiont]BAS67621.1 hypothetical protein BSEPE_0616 [endosymbiont of Bathymodiolus septemdierum str. Myojin knoll]
MAEYIGQNQEQTGKDISVDFFPVLKVSDFQSRFNNLKETDVDVVSVALIDATDKVSHHLKKIKSKFNDFDTFVNKHELDDAAVRCLFARAVHNFAMGDILSSSITTSDTKYAEDRVSNLQERINMHESQARQAISMLQRKPTILAKVV